MRARVTALAVAVLTAAGMLAVFTPGSATAASFPGSAAFSGSSTGTAVHADVLQVPGAPRLVDGEIAFSGEAANTAGLNGGVVNEMNETVATSSAKNSYGRGSAVELGLGTTVPDATKDVNQAIITGLAESSAPPNGGLVTKDAAIPGDPLIYASLLRGQAEARWNPNFCIIGAPVGYGLGSAADAQLIDTGTKNPDGSMGAPLVAADIGTPTDRTVSSSKSFTYLRPEPDGTFAVVSETHETLAPVTLFKNMTGAELKIEVAGEWVLRTVSTGKPGGSFVEYAPAGNQSPTTPLITITPPGAASQIILKTQDLFGPGKIPTQISLPPAPSGQYLAQVNVGEDPRAPGSEENPTKPITSADGTTTNAAVDVVRVDLVVPATKQHIGEVRIGHMEAKSVAPVGGVDCPIPVTKTANPDPVTAGNPFTWTITIPSTADALAGTDCDLTNIKADDVTKVLSGSPRATISGASNGGVVDKGTVDSSHTGHVVFSNLGTYHPGGPPIVVTINGNIPATSGAGVLQNTVTVTASLGNCKGGAAGQDIVGSATITGTANVVGAAVKGTAFVNGPNVKAAAVLPARLAETGQNEPWLPVLGGGLLLGSLALMRSRRRLLVARSETR